MLGSLVGGGEKGKKERDGPLLTWAPSSITHRNVELPPRLGKKSTIVKEETGCRLRRG